ncbi:MAG TPA: FecR domain-containing protein [Stellaceae bacterium]|nr:FecR domain-containing protein [Stellaceae bacterium]
MRMPRSASRIAGLLALAAGVAASLVPAPGSAQKIGVSSAVNPDVNTTPPGSGMRRLVIGQEVVYNEHITTSANGQTQILFLDESSMTIGPNSDITIDKFVYNPQTGAGQMAVTATKGALRYVGGRLSKQDNAVTVSYRTATIGIRGGSFLADAVAGKPLEVIFIYGKAVQVTGQSGCAQTISRPSFEVSVAAPGACPSAPAPAPLSAISAILAQLNGTPGQTGGARNMPTAATVAASGISNTVSGNLPASVQQAVQNSPPAAQPAQVNVANPPATTNVSTIQASSQPKLQQAAIEQSQTGHVTPPQPPPPPTPPPPVVVTVAGLIKSTNGHGAAGLGFTDQSGQARIPFSGATITYPQTAPPLSGGAFAVNVPNIGQSTLSPLTPGSQTAVTGQSPLGPAAGTAFTTADGTFFYSYLTPTASPSERVFVFGGTPVSQAFFTPVAQQSFLTFQLQPDGALASGTQPQTIPFLPPQFGGSMPNASVSNLFIGVPINSFLGDTGTSVATAKFLQGSLAVNGQGASQTSALAITTGQFFPEANTGMAAGGGGVVGTVMPAATASPVHISSAVATVPDANGNSLFGGNSLSGFVLDQNNYPINVATLTLQLASAAQFGQTTANYAFNQPALATATPSTVGSQTQSLNESGFFGGIMTHTTNPATGSPYVISGTTTVGSVAASDRLSAVFSGSDPFTAAQSGLNNLVLSFGSTTSQTNGAFGTYIDNNLYGARASVVTPSSINGNTLALPQNSTTATPSPSIGMVTSAVVGNNWFPSGVTACACQFLQWGYWTGQLSSTTSQGFGVNRTDRAYINTWLAGMPTVTLPTTGIGTYNGAAVGTVFNNGATYLAAGNFNQTYNFGTMSGTVNITNFDGQNYTATVSGSGRTFGGNLIGLSNSGLEGPVNGGFFGPNAKETGGNFNIFGNIPTRYFASGIFAGKQ